MTVFTIALVAQLAAAGVVSAACNGPANGLVDGDEQCETGACCTDECELRPAASVCRESADAVCDPEEICGEQEPGVEAGCPADAVSADGTECDDQSFCTTGDACMAGACTGSQRDCSDDNACTDDSCDEQADECLHADNSAPCEDGSFCTVGDTCSEGTCKPGTERDCDDDNACTDDACDEEAEECSHAANTAGCDDGSFCTTGDACVAGTCTGSVRDCADDDACTDDSCDEVADACQHVENTAPCDDGFFCTIGDTCNAGICAGSPNTCDDQSSCTSDTCIEEGDQCAHENLEGACDDFCVLDGVCDDGVCTGQARDCADDNSCTDDSCDEAGDQCAHAANTVACDDGSFCTVGDACSGGTCSGQARSCSDGNACTDDTCDEERDECVNPANTAPCDDGDACTADDTCSDGVCAGVGACTTTTTLPECPVCGDFNEDCEITATDALLVLQTAVGLHECSLEVCDFNGDGRISVVDALAVLRASVGLPSDPQCASGATTTTEPPTTTVPDTTTTTLPATTTTLPPE